MGKKSTPKPPDYEAAAERTSEGNIELVNAQTTANRPDQYTPWGSSTWEQNGDQWTQNVELSPEQQRSLDQQMGIQTSRSELAGDMFGRVQDEFGGLMDWDQFGEYSRSPEAGGLSPEQLQRNLSSEGLQNVDSSNRYYDQAGDALYNRATSRLDPQWSQRAEEQEAALRNQGLNPGDEAYDNAMANMNMDRTDAYQQAGYGADIGAGQEAQRMFGMDSQLRGQQFGERGQQGAFANQAAGQAFGMGAQAGAQNFGQGLQASGFDNTVRQSQISEEMQQRGFSLNEINAILSGQQIGMPSMPGFNTAERAQGADYMGAANAQWGADMDAFSAQQAQSQMLMDGVTGAAGMFMPG